MAKRQFQEQTDLEDYIRKIKPANEIMESETKSEIEQILCVHLNQNVLSFQNN